MHIRNMAEAWTGSLLEHEGEIFTLGQYMQACWPRGLCLAWWSSRWDGFRNRLSQIGHTCLDNWMNEWLGQNLYYYTKLLKRLIIGTVQQLDKVSCRNACTLFYSDLNYPKITLQIVMYDPEMGNVIHFGEKLIGTQILSVCDLKTDR